VALGGWSVGPQSSHPRQLVPAQTLDFRDASGRYFASLSLASDGGVILSLEDVAQFSDGGTFVAYPYLILWSKQGQGGEVTVRPYSTDESFIHIRTPDGALHMLKNKGPSKGQRPTSWSP